MPYNLLLLRHLRKNHLWQEEDQRHLQTFAGKKVPSS
jgi:hypothetical protein